MNDFDAEEALISCLITEPESIENVYGMVSPEMFESSILGKMYFEYRKAFDEHKNLTIVELNPVWIPFSRRRRTSASTKSGCTIPSPPEIVTPPPDSS